MQYGSIYSAEEYSLAATFGSGYLAVAVSLPK